MQREDARVMMVYYSHIPEMLKLFVKQKQDIELTEYNSVRGMDMDGMPHGSSCGSATETYAIAAAENGGLERIREIEKRIGTLEHDAAAIRSCLDQLNSYYKLVVIYKLVNGYSWAKVGHKLSRPESTCRVWLDRSLARLGECFDGIPDATVILSRASRAR